MSKQYSYIERKIPATPRNKRVAGLVTNAVSATGGGYIGGGGTSYWQLVTTDEEGNSLPDDKRYLVPVDKYNVMSEMDVVAYSTGNKDIVLPIASSSALGAILVGSGLSIDSDGKLSVIDAGSLSGIDVTGEGNVITGARLSADGKTVLLTKDIKALTVDDLSTHTKDTILHITSDERLRWNEAYGKMHEHSNKAHLDVINQNLSTTSAVHFSQVLSTGEVVAYATGGSDLVLPIASTSALGAVKIGDGLAIDANGVLSATEAGSIGNVVVGGSGNAITTASASGSTLTLTKGITFWHADNDGAGSGLDADMLDGTHKSVGTSTWGCIPWVGTDGVMEIGRYVDFHFSNGESNDYSTRLETQGQYSNKVYLPSRTGTLALTTDTVANATNFAGYSIYNYQGGGWYYMDAFVYDPTNSTRYYWYKVAHINAKTVTQCRLEIMIHDDFNYPVSGLYILSMSSFTDGSNYYSYSINLQCLGTASVAQVNAVIDTNGDVWIRAWNIDWSHTFKFRKLESVDNIIVYTSGWESLESKFNSFSTKPSNSCDILQGSGARLQFDWSGNLTSTKYYTNTNYFGDIISNANVKAEGDIIAYSTGSGEITLPIASSSALGAIKVGTGLSIASDGTLSATGSGSVGNIVINPTSGNVITNAALSSDGRTITFTKDLVAWHAGNDGSGSGLDADMLDGVHYQNILERIRSGFSNTISTPGWFRIGETTIPNNSGINFLLFLYRGYTHVNNEVYIFSISIAWNGSTNITQLSGIANKRLITKIRIDWTVNKTSYIDIYVDTQSVGNVCGWTTIGSAKSYTSWIANPTLAGTAYEFTTDNGVKSDKSIQSSYQLISTVATGTKPISVASTTVCTNLNADLLDGIHASGLFTNLSNSGNNLSVTIGGTNKTLTVGYASTASNSDTVDGYHASSLARSGVDYLSFTTTVAYNQWNRVANVKALNWGDGVSFIITIGTHHSSTVNNVTFFCSASFGGKISIREFSGANLSNISIRVSGENYPDTAYIDLMSNSSPTGTGQTYRVKIIGLLCANISEDYVANSSPAAYYKTATSNKDGAITTDGYIFADKSIRSKQDVIAYSTGTSNAPFKYWRPTVSGGVLRWSDDTSTTQPNETTIVGQGVDYDWSGTKLRLRKIYADGNYSTGDSYVDLKGTSVGGVSAVSTSGSSGGASVYKVTDTNSNELGRFTVYNGAAGANGIFSKVSNYEGSAWINYTSSAIIRSGYKNITSSIAVGSQANGESITINNVLSVTASIVYTGSGVSSGSTNDWVRGLHVIITRSGNTFSFNVFNDGTKAVPAQSSGVLRIFWIAICSS